jgi:hypothetical protein
MCYLAKNSPNIVFLQRKNTDRIVMKPTSIKLIVLVLSFSFLLGCASAPVNSGHDSFADYAESVFRRQNQLSSRLMMLNDDAEDEEVFDVADQEMRDACHLLNEYAEREISGESMSWRFKSKVQDSIEACDKSVQRMEVLFATAVKDH